ncbi:hypothetical protein EFO91_15410 [Lactiplantibacillus plantarum]|uniref:hypothetical protein n=1 Tax=Lactiplantibacillus plantarum TaxID=1590 RepID=UPI000976FABA|nr:hypothetical protein [Lactiplantibacillus plantarum]MCT3227001.1 hypothetical protein [Lactiplantibacillus plantarum]MCT3274371.1 hypothetical protein [Lactiplantibacillus plantarum]RDD76526.1 hypothetical protein DVV32_13435 [Lactiplantibacillus plantarum]
MIADIIVSQRASIENNNRIIINPFVLYRLPSFPAIYTFAVSVTINDINKNDGKRIELILTSKNDYKNELLSRELPDEAFSQPNLAINLEAQNVDIPEPGKYTLTLKLSGNEMATKEIYFEQKGK